MQTSVIDAMAKAMQQSHLSTAVRPQQSQPRISDVAKGMNGVTFRFVAASQLNERKEEAMIIMNCAEYVYYLKYEVDNKGDLLLSKVGSKEDFYCHPPQHPLKGAI